MFSSAFLARSAACLGVCLLAPVASAVVIDVTASPTSTGALFDSRGFELDTPNTFPSSSNLLPTSPAPSWEQSNTNNVIQVLQGDQSSIGGPTSAFQGDAYLQIYRPDTATNFNAQLGRDITPATESFTLAMAVYMKPFSDDATANDPYIIFSLNRSNDTGPNVTTALSSFGFRYGSTGTPEVVRYNGTGTALVPSVNFTPGAWNTLEFSWDSTLAATDPTNAAVLSLNGGTPFSVYQNNGFANAVGQLLFRHNTSNSGVGGAVYIDSIPEPSSIGVVIGAALLMVRRRRARTA
jgi:hypothetical protein